MARRATQEDREAAARAEIAEAKKEGKTELSISTESPETVKAIFEVTTLTKLRLSTGPMEELPPGLGNLVNLESLNLENNQLKRLPAEIGKLIRLDRLYAYSNKFEEIPEEIGNLKALKKLVLWSNQLRSLPAGMGGLEKLEELELQRNKLTALPSELGNCAALKKLEAHDNELSYLHPTWGGMKSIDMAILGNNKFTAFPEELFDAPKIGRISLGGNKIPSIPDGIARCRSLRELTLPGNVITKIPDALCGMKSVMVLDLEGNKITDVPASIGGMSSLADLSLEDNPIRNVPAEVVAEGKDAIFRHLGLTKIRTVSGDLPADEKERAGTVKAYKERLDQFVRDAKHKLFDQKVMDSIVAFVSGKTDEVPAARLKDHYSFGHIAEALSPYEKWTFVDRRMLRFMAQEAWYFRQPGHDYMTGYHDEFFAWLKKQMKETKEPALFEKLAAEFRAAGANMDSFIESAMDELHASIVVEGSTTPTPFGRWILANVKEMLPAILVQAKQFGSVRDSIIALFLAHDRASFEKVAPELLVIKPDEDGETHLPYAALKVVCASEPARWEPLLMEGLAKTDCLPCKAEAGKVLVDAYPKHAEKAFTVACEVLAEISERKNKKDRFEFYWSGGERWTDATPQYVEWVLTTFGEKAVKPVFDHVEKTKIFDADVAEVVARKVGQKGIDIVGEGLSMTIADDEIAGHFRKMFDLLAPLDWSKFHEKAWTIAQSEFRNVRRAACAALAKLDEKTVRPKAQALLSEKKAHQREAGVLILSQLKSKEAAAILEGLLDSEKTDDARDVVVEALYRNEKAIDAKEIARRVASAKARGKLEKPAAKWIDEKKLPAPSWSGGKKLDAESIRFLFYRQTRRTEIEADPESRAILAKIDRRSAASFAEKLLALVMKNGGPSSKTRFALSLVGSLGGDDVIAALEKNAVDARNENAVATIGLLGSMEAARSLDRIARVFRTKYPNVRERAKDAFATIAASMGMTPFELSDAMIPDFGFKGLTRPLAAGKRKLALSIGTDRTFVFLDEKGNVLKTPPKELSAKQKAEMKALAGELKDAQRALAASLEYYLISRRRWTASDWQAFFLKRPLPFAFAQTFVWSAFDGAKPKSIFQVHEDASLTDAAGAKLTLPKGAIGLVHPLDLDDATTNAWLNVAVRTLMPPFQQIDRPVFHVPDEDANKTSSFQFESSEVSAATFKSRAERRGWRRGSVVDSGAVSSYRKEFPAEGLEVFLRVEGVGVQSFGFDDDGSEAEIKDFFFVKSGSVATGSYTWDEPRDASDKRLIRFSALPPIVFSETIADIQAIVADKKVTSDD